MSSVETFVENSIALLNNGVKCHEVLVLSNCNIVLHASLYLQSNRDAKNYTNYFDANYRTVRLYL